MSNRNNRFSTRLPENGGIYSIKVSGRSTGLISSKADCLHIYPSVSGCSLPLRLTPGWRLGSQE